MRAIKRMNGSSLIFPWKREKKKVNKFTTEKPLPEVSIPGAWPGQFKGGGRVTLSNRGYSPDRHVDLYAVLKKGLQRGW